MSLAITETPVPSLGRPDKTDIASDDRLNISAVYTSVDSTLEAVIEAGALAHNLDGGITLLAPQVVPHPRPLDSSPVSIEFNEHRFRIVAAQCPVETRVRIYLCRDRFQMLTSVRKQARLSCWVEESAAGGAPGKKGWRGNWRKPAAK